MVSLFFFFGWSLLIEEYRLHWKMFCDAGLSVIMTSVTKAPPHIVNAPRYDRSYPHSEATGSSREKVLFTSVSPVAGT